MGLLYFFYERLEKILGAIFLIALLILNWIFVIIGAILILLWKKKYYIKNIVWRLGGTIKYFFKGDKKEINVER